MILKALVAATASAVRMTSLSTEGAPLPAIRSRIA